MWEAEFSPKFKYGRGVFVVEVNSKQTITPFDLFYYDLKNPDSNISCMAWLINEGCIHVEAFILIYLACFFSIRPLFFLSQNGSINIEYDKMI